MTTEAVTRHTHHASPVHEPPAAIRATGIIVVLTVVLAILAIAFALPAARSKPHARSDRRGRAAWPPVVKSPTSSSSTLPALSRSPTTPAKRRCATRSATATVYGGISFGADGRKLLIATGGSPMVAQMLTQVGNGIAQQARMPLHTEDLAPPTADDPRGAGLAASALPITLAGLLPAVALVLLLKREIWTRLTAAVVFAAVAGTTIAALLRYVFGSIDQNVWGVAAGLTLGTACRRAVDAGAGLAVRTGGVGDRRIAGAAAGQPAVGPDQRAADAAERLGHLRSVATAGRNRDAAAVHCLLRRRRCDDSDSRADLLGGDGSDAGRVAASVGVTRFATSIDARPPRQPALVASAPVPAPATVGGLAQPISFRDDRGEFHRH